MAALEALITYKRVAIARGKYMLHEQYILVTMRSVLSPVWNRLINLKYF